MKSLIPVSTSWHILSHFDFVPRTAADTPAVLPLPRPSRNCELFFALDVNRNIQEGSHLAGRNGYWERKDTRHAPRQIRSFFLFPKSPTPQGTFQCHKKPTPGQTQKTQQTHQIPRVNIRVNLEGFTTLTHGDSTGSVPVKPQNSWARHEKTVLKFFLQPLKLPPGHAHLLSFSSPIHSSWELPFFQFCDSFQHLLRCLVVNTGW